MSPNDGRSGAGSGPTRPVDTLRRLLERGHRLSQDEVSARLDVSKRHVRRLVKRLRESDVPVQEAFEDRKRVYYLAPEDQPAANLPIRLTDQQILALAVASETARATLQPTPLGGALQEALRVLTAEYDPHILSFKLNGSAPRWPFSDRPRVDLDPDIVLDLRQAISERRSVRIDYRPLARDGKIVQHTIDPFVIAVCDGRWLCAAYAHELDEVRNYNLAGIEALRPCDPEDGPATYTIPDAFDPEAHFSERFEGASRGEPHTVRLLVEPARASLFRRKQYHPTQEIEKTGERGWLIVRYQVAELDEAAAFVRSWGPSVLVLDPPSLAARVAAEHLYAARRYWHDTHWTEEEGSTEGSSTTESGEEVDL